MPQIESDHVTAHPADYEAFLERTGLRLELAPYPGRPGIRRILMSVPDGDALAHRIPLAHSGAPPSQSDLLRLVQREALGLLTMGNTYGSPEHPLHRAASEAYVALAMAGDDLTEHGTVLGDVCVTLEDVLGERDFTILMEQLGDAPGWLEGLPRAPVPGV